MSLYRELDVNLTPQQKALKEGVHQFSELVLRPAALALDRMSDPQGFILHSFPPSVGALAYRASACTLRWKNWGGAARSSRPASRWPVSPSPWWRPPVERI